MRRWALRAGLALVAFLALVYGAISWQMAGGVTKAKREPLSATPASVGLEYRDVSFHPRGEQGLTLRGWLMPAPHPLGTVIMVHGVDSNRASEGVGMLDIARGLVERGFSVLAFDLRGHGGSDTGQVSGGFFERRDLLGAFDFLVGQEGERPERIGVLGFSLGAAVALLAAAQEPRLRAVVADSPFADISDLIVQEARRRTSIPGFAVPWLVPGMVKMARWRFGIDIGQVAPEKVMHQLDFPVLLIHGLEDTRIPPEHSRRLKARARHPDTRLWLVPGAEHARAFKTHPQEYLERVSAYFRDRFR